MKTNDEELQQSIACLDVTTASWLLMALTDDDDGEMAVLINDLASDIRHGLIKVTPKADDTAMNDVIATIEERLGSKIMPYVNNKLNNARASLISTVKALADGKRLFGYTGRDLEIYSRGVVHLYRYAG